MEHRSAARIRTLAPGVPGRRERLKRRFREVKLLAQRDRGLPSRSRSRRGGELNEGACPVVIRVSQPSPLDFASVCGALEGEYLQS